MAYVKDLIKQAWLVVMAMLLIHLCLAEAFEYSAYCESQCKIGRGGNLCRCNAVHFAGKRTLGSTGGKEPAYNSIYDRAPGYDGIRKEELVRLLSYLINSDRTGKELLQEREEAYPGEEGVGDNREMMSEDKRFGSDRTMPYR